MTLLFNFIKSNKAHIMWALLLFCIISNAQSPYNLVPNYSFEQNTNCSVSSGGGGALNWNSTTILSYAQYSYFNACTTKACCGIPSDTYGYGWQYARTGNGMTGFWFTYNDGSNSRIYLQTELIDSLKTNHCYYIEFYVNLFNYAKYANNNISLLVGDTAIWYNNINPAYANPQILQYGNPCITDTVNWVRVGGIYTAHGGESYITIGNFTDDAHTDTLRVRSVGSYSAYYIDDVSVIPLDSMQLKADAGRDTTIVKGDSVWIGSRLCGLQNVVWYDAGGNVIDTGAPGLWVKPTANTFYIIEQNVCGQYSRDTVYINVQALPVIITNYELRITNGIQKNGVANVWETSTEINTAYYNVQRSADGINFYTIGKVNAKGAGKYNFIDDRLPSNSILYYRLEIVDKNGALSYSEVREISVGNAREIIVYPNPTQGEINIELPESGNWQITACDLEGRIVWQQLCSGCNGTIQHRLEGSKGMYFIKITNTSNGQQTVQKVILQ